MLVLDGSQGEGGGQILRSALGLALVTGQPFRLEQIRSRRRQPGLRRQHLTAVAAAAEVGQAQVEGAALGSQALTFRPGSARPGTFRFDVGTAGSATLVLQTVLPALLRASGPSTVTLEGGTHNPLAPPFEFLEAAFLPLVERLGPTVRPRLERHGFYPAGGGRIVVEVSPAATGELRPLELLERGALRRTRARALVARLPRTIAARELATVAADLGLRPDALETVEVRSAGPGNALLIEVESEQVTEVFVGFGERGVPAERVAGRAAAEARRYLEAGVPVSEHLADQLLLPLALAGGGAFRTLAPSSHTRTNIDTIRRFVDVGIELHELGADDWRVDISRR